MCLYQQYKYGPYKQRKMNTMSNISIKTVHFLLNEYVSHPRQINPYPAVKQQDTHMQGSGKSFQHLWMW